MNQIKWNEVSIKLANLLASEQLGCQHKFVSPTQLITKISSKQAKPEL